MNRVELIGGLTRDPVLKGARYPQADLTVAVNGARWDPQSRGQVVYTVYAVVNVYGSMVDQVMGLRQGDEVYVLGEFDQTENDKGEKKTRVRAKTITATRTADAVVPHPTRTWRQKSREGASTPAIRIVDGEPPEDPF